MNVNALKLARMECGMNQLDLAQRLGISEKMISFWETNRCKPSIAQCVDLARILKVNPERLFPEMFRSGFGVDEDERPATDKNEKIINYD